MGFWGAITSSLGSIGEYCESAGRGALNAVSGSAHLGDKFYDRMGDVVQQHIDGIANVAHDQAVAQATAHGADALHAEMAGQQAIGAKMDSFINPQSLGGFAKAVGTTAECSVKTVETVASDVLKEIEKFFTPDVMSGLTPLLIGAGLIGGAYLAVNALSHHEPQNQYSL